MTKYLRRTALASATAAALAVTMAVPAVADNNVQNGAVNLAVGRILIKDLNIGVAAQIAAAICGVDVGPIAVLGAAVDAGGPTRTVCTVFNQPVQLMQD
jgi:hypothetical protein